VISGYQYYSVATGLFSESVVMNFTAVFHCIVVPDEDRIDRRAGLIVQEFKSLVFSADYQPGAKRKVRCVQLFVVLLNPILALW